MLAIFLWLICVVVAVTATVTAQWVAAIFWWAVVVSLFIWHYGWRRVKCLLGWHEWSMTRGYNGAPHKTAVCVHCGDTPVEYQ